MIDSPNIMISLEHCHAQNILRGIKTVELRRRKLHIPRSTLIWIYAKFPSQAVVGCAAAREIISMSPATMWRVLGERSGIQKSEFDSYFDRRDKAHAILLDKVERLERNVSLAELRAINSRFNPPQFFKYLDGTEELALLRKHHDLVNMEYAHGE
jgi:predicted transcriptional regulator